MGTAPGSTRGSIFELCANVRPVSDSRQTQAEGIQVKQASSTGERARQLKAAALADALEGLLGRPVQSGRRSKPLDSLIATLLSQNTNDRNSHQAWLNLRKKFPTWEKVLAAPAREIARVIEVGGLKNQKAKRIRQILRTVRSDAGSFDLRFLQGKTNEEAIHYLVSMKGVGLKTAACVLVFSLGRDVFPVDTHIHRLCNRLGLAKTKTAEQTYDQMQALVPKGRAYSFHVNLIRFGRKICRAQNPLCGVCPLFDHCVFPQKDLYAMRQTPGKKASARNVDFMILDHVA
jgi:endonuclease-3